MDILVKWKNPNIEYDGTRIYRSEEPIYDVGVLPEVLATVGFGVEEHLDVGLTSGKTYYYRFESFRGLETVTSDMLTVKALRYTGPGPQELISGDEEIGFYGEVPDEDLMNTAELMGMLPSIGGAGPATAGYFNQSWLKFAYHGKTLFISKFARRSRVTWTSVYNAGIALGIDGPGEDIDLPPVNQNRTITKGRDTFLVSLPTGSNSPFDSVKTAYEPCMIDDLIYRVMLDYIPTQRGGNLSDLVKVVGSGNRLVSTVERGATFTCLTTEAKGSETILRFTVNNYSGAVDPTNKLKLSINYAPAGAHTIYTAWLPVLTLV